MRIAVVQLSSGPDPAANLVLVEDLTRRAAGQGAELVVFPEATMASFSRRSAEVAEALDGPWAGQVRVLAAELGLTIVVGMFTTAPDGRVYNTLLVTGQGAETAYHKIHLFDALGYAESAQIAPGNRAVDFTVSEDRVGVAICYDLRFPALFTHLAANGAELLVVSAAWAPGPQKIHQWRALATARAMDATAFVVAVDQALPEDSAEHRPTGVGHSLVVDPSGTVLRELGSDPELVVLDLDLSQASRLRERLPVLEHAKAWTPTA